MFVISRGSVEPGGEKLVDQVLGRVTDLGRDAAEVGPGARGDGSEGLAEGAVAIGEGELVEESDGVGGAAGAGGFTEEDQNLGPSLFMELGASFDQEAPRERSGFSPVSFVD